MKGIGRTIFIEPYIVTNCITSISLTMHCTGIFSHTQLHIKAPDLGCHYTENKYTKTKGAQNTRKKISG